MSNAPATSLLRDEASGHLSPAEQRLRPVPAVRRSTVDIRFATIVLRVGTTSDSIEVECHGHVVPSFRGSRETPAELGGYVIDSVWHGLVNLSTVLPEEILDALHREVNGQ